MSQDPVGRSAERAEMVRFALGAVVAHWPGDLTGLEISSLPEDRADYGNVRVCLVFYDDGFKYGQTIIFSPHELQLRAEGWYMREKVHRVCRDMARDLGIMHKPTRPESSDRAPSTAETSSEKT